MSFPSGSPSYLKSRGSQANAIANKDSLADAGTQAKADSVQMTLQVPMPLQMQIPCRCHCRCSTCSGTVEGAWVPGRSPGQLLGMDLPHT